MWLTAGTGTYLSILLHQSYVSKCHHILALTEFNEMITKDHATAAKEAIFPELEVPCSSAGMQWLTLHTPTPLQSRALWVWQHTEKGIGKGLEPTDKLLWVPPGKKRIQEHLCFCLWAIHFFLWTNWFWMERQQLKSKEKRLQVSYRQVRNNPYESKAAVLTGLLPSTIICSMPSEEKKGSTYISAPVG